tara:strand:+ start:240 stop:467 length:228 start_codon:yes stop_codon:yes gene_type:complete
MNSVEHLFDKRIVQQKDQIIQKQEELIESLQTSINQSDEKMKYVIGIIDDILADPDPNTCTTLLILAKLNQILKS